MNITKLRIGQKLIDPTNNICIILAIYKHNDTIETASNGMIGVISVESYKYITHEPRNNKNTTKVQKKR